MSSLVLISGADPTFFPRVGVSPSQKKNFTIDFDLDYSTLTPQKNITPSWRNAISWGKNVHLTFAEFLKTN
jgi:hypothetical protein